MIYHSLVESLRGISLMVIKALSRLDRFLISKDWLNSWSNLSQWGLQRSVFDHCAVVLKEKEVNWGPKPFQMMRCWEDMEGYADFVKKRNGVV